LQVGRVGSSTDLIAQHVEYVQQDQKRETVLDCVNTVEGLTLVFVETKRGADQLEDYLLRQNLPATSIHGDKSQAEREMVRCCCCCSLSISLLAPLWLAFHFSVWGDV
jgi:ATP-dependent RNA helicase DDX3X